MQTEIRLMRFAKKFYNFEVIKLPSTSPANAKFSLEKLVDEWKIILKYLE